MLTVLAYAKINLSLEVLNRRDDKYHEIVSVMQTVNLYDVLKFELSDTICLKSTGVHIDNSNNLILRAAKLLQSKTGISRGVSISLDKKIPLSAGLGGGSSDAAATLNALNVLWNLNLSHGNLMAMASELGSDVPFFIHGGTALVYGRGELIRRLNTNDLWKMVILSPPIDIPGKTARLYSKLSQEYFTKGLLTRKLESRILGGGDLPPQLLFNVFESVAFEAFTELKHYWDTFHYAGAREIHLVGSGPSMFAPVMSESEGVKLQSALRHVYGWTAYLVDAIQPI